MKELLRLWNIPNGQALPTTHLMIDTITYLHAWYRDYSFISVQIDGKTEADFYCSFEGLYYYAFHLAEILWGILWLYDVQVLTGKPGLFTGKYLMYYACVAYFAAFGFSIVLYFQNVDNFTSVSLHTLRKSTKCVVCVALASAAPYLK